MYQRPHASSISNATRALLTSSTDMNMNLNIRDVAPKHMETSQVNTHDTTEQTTRHTK